MSPLAVTLKVASAVAVGIGPGVVMYRLALTPSRPPVTTGVRGLRRRRALRTSDAWAAVEPTVRWLGVRVRPFVTPALHDALDRKIMLAGDLAGLVAEEVVALCLACAAAGAIAGWIVGHATGVGSALAVLLSMFGPLLPLNRLSEAQQRRLSSIGRRMPHFVELLSLSVGAGLDFPGGVRQFVEKASDPNDPLVEELALLLQSLHLGRSRRTALGELAERAPIDSVREFVTTIIQAEERGNSIASALNVLATMARLKRSIDAEEKASRAGLAMLAPLGLMLVSLLLLLMAPMLLGMKAMFR